MYGVSALGSGGVKQNASNIIEVSSPPDDTISSMEFSPSSVPTTFLAAGCWDSNVRLWEVQKSGVTVPKDMKNSGAPILDVCWSDDGTKVFTASCDKTVKGWDLSSNQYVTIGQHDAPIRSVHWVKAPNYTCLMTGGWDRNLKFWDTRSPNPMLTIQLPERCYCADVKYPMGIVSTAQRGIIIYQLDGTPREYKKVESPLKYQHRAVAIFADKNKGDPVGFALGSVEGRVAVQYVSPTNPKDNFTFKCHRSTEIVNGSQDIYAVNDIAFHPIHGTLATVGSDGRYSFWDKDQRTKLKTSDQMEQSITKCAFDASGQIFAYAVGYDWSKGHEHVDPSKKPKIFLQSCFDDMKQRPKA
ncbi:unnamed protein product [Notodromas monacha]|uniref:mRNA export factor n=1 Tax=Notodromas monacha TaxID=399045 RepID=A0A7R9BG05_9CRUS|nr:unnamed protein product [Notodromas monacha]CAG0914771.1 unnamed protein product [Notodromas monacha]